MLLENPLPNEAFSIIASLSNSQSCGYDGIPSYYLKIAADAISNPLCYLLKHSFCFGIFPSSLKIAKVIPILKSGLKIAKVIPIFKSGAKDHVSNYRPISILPCFSKVLEKLIFKRTENFLSKNSILLPTQYGFRAGRSTFHTLLDVITNTYDNISENMFTSLMMLDLKKAFDTVSHDQRRWKYFQIGGGLKFVLSCQRLGGKAPQILSLFSQHTSYVSCTLLQ